MASLSIFGVSVRLHPTPPCLAREFAPDLMVYVMCVRLVIVSSLSGCIFAELLTHKAVFQGENPLNQLELIVSKLGCPRREKLDFVESPAALSQMLRYENKRPPPFRALFPPNSNPEALGSKI